MILIFLNVSLEPGHRGRAENCKIMAAKHFELKVNSIYHIEGVVVITQCNIYLFVAIWNYVLLACFL